MSPNTVTDLASSFVQMAKAYEELPGVREELDRANQTISIQADTIMSREAAIMKYKEQIEALQSRVRATEAERDDAELRFLELDEKAHKVINLAKTMQTSLADSMNLLDPPKPLPEPIVEQPPVPEAVHSIEPQPQGQGEASPTSANTLQEDTKSLEIDTSNATLEDVSAKPVGEATAPQSPTNQGQSEVNPSAEAVSGQSPVVEQAIVSEKVGGVTEASGPYTNKLYSAHPVYVTYHDWLAGGGTDYSYYH